MRQKVMILMCLLAFLQAGADERIYRTDNVVVSYEGIGEEHARAIARTVDAARAIAAEEFGFDLPGTVGVTIRCKPGGRTRLYTDGRDHVYLTLRSEKDLRKPSTTRIFHIYGMCHELAHISMYRLIPDHSWMAAAGAEGWAHYLGSRIVDRVYAKEGEKLWCDPYDYRADGMARLEKQLAAKRQTPVARGAGLWMRLGKIVGDKKIAPIFKAWGKAKIDPVDPGAALRRTLLRTNADDRLKEWWNAAEPLIVLKRPKSGFAVRTLPPGQLSGKPMELVQDDGKSAGQRSMAGGGHAVQYEVHGDTWYLTSIRIYGSRYGRRRAPMENFHVWVCDADFKVIADIPFPYGKFTTGAPRWVALPVKPTNVPAKFIICVGFNPTSTKGVFVHHDGEGSGNSFSGLPGRGKGAFSRGDWMIRVILDQPKTADPLKPIE